MPCKECAKFDRNPRIMPSSTSALVSVVHGLKRLGMLLGGHNNMSQREQLVLLWAAIWFAVCYIASRKFRQSLDADRWDDIEAESKQWNI